MKKPLIIFGAGDIAELVYFYFTTDSCWDVVAFTVDSKWIDRDEFCGKPVIDFESLEKYYPPTDYSVFVAVSYSGLNRLRREKYEYLKRAGYEFASYISSRATILNNYEIGENCLILENNTIQPFVSIGHNVTLWSGNHIGHHCEIGDHTFVSSHVVVSGGVRVGSSCFIGVNATLRDHIVVGDQCVIGAGVLLLSDAESGGVYMVEGAQRSKVPSNRIRRI